MNIHPVVTQANGIISMSIEAQFIGDSTDASDKALIQAYGDPKINLAGTFTDSAASLVFAFPATELYVGLTTQMQNYTARFMLSLPPQSPYPPNGPFPPGNCPPNFYWQWNQPQGNRQPGLGPLDCITTNPTTAVTFWFNTIVTSRIVPVMTALRAMTVYTPPGDHDF